MNRKRIIVLGIISFIVALLFQVPAGLIADLAQSNTRNLVLSGARGSIWSGKILQATYGNLELGEIDWNINPLGILGGGLGGSFKQRGTSLASNGDFRLGINKILRLRNTDFDLDGSALNDLQKYATLEGRFIGRINHLAMKTDVLDNPPPVVSGVLNWEQGGMESPITLPPGNYQLRIKPDSGGNLQGELSSNDAPVDLNGSVTLDHGWQYTTNISLKTTPKGKALTGLISMAGKRNPDGSINITEEGNLLQLIRK